MNQGSTTNPTVPHWYYTLATAEVIFSDGDGVSGRRVQFATKSDGNTFPLDRINQTHKSAIRMVQSKLPPETKIEILEVLILNLLPLGYMSAAEFGEEPVAEQAPPAQPTALTETSEVHPSQMGHKITPIR